MDETLLQQERDKVAPGYVPAGLVIIMVVATAGATLAAAFSFYGARAGAVERSALLCLAGLEAQSDQSLARLVIAGSTNDRARAETAVAALEAIDVAIQSIGETCPDIERTPLNLSDFPNNNIDPTPSVAESSSESSSTAPGETIMVNATAPFRVITPMPEPSERPTGPQAPAPSVPAPRPSLSESGGVLQEVLELLTPSPLPAG